MTSAEDAYGDLAAALAPCGLMLRGGFKVSSEDFVAGLSPDLSIEGAATLAMIGNAGPAMWSVFSRQRAGNVTSLDEWTESVLTPVAEAFGVQVIYPWTKPYQPFQKWAMRSEPVWPSPLGLLIHPRYGLWHAYRAAFVFPNEIDLPEHQNAQSPCNTCAEKPCLSACPVAAFTDEGFDVAACASHISQSADKQLCRSKGCLARAACPVGVPDSDEQILFHMDAFYSSRAAT